MNVSTGGYVEAAREAINNADEAFLIARRAIAKRQRTEIDEVLVLLDGKLDEARDAFRARRYDHGCELLTGVKLLMRDLCTVQSENQRKEIELLLEESRDSMQYAVNWVENICRDAEYGAWAERALRKTAVIQEMAVSVDIDTQSDGRVKVPLPWVIAIVSVIAAVACVLGRF